MSREEAIKVLNMVEAHGLADEAKQMAIKALQFDIRKWADEHFIELVEKDVWADAKKALQAQAKDKNRMSDLKHFYRNGEELKQIDYPTVKAQADGDLVSRQAVLDTTHKTIYEFFDIADDNSEEPINDQDKLLLTVNKAICNKIKELPSVNPQEPKTGHWKRISMDKYTEHAKYWYRCDRCGKDNLGNTDWCPNCGADMRGDTDEVSD